MSNNYLDRRDICDEVAKNFMLEKPKFMVRGNFRIDASGKELSYQTREELYSYGLHCTNVKEFNKRLKRLKDSIKSGDVVLHEPDTFNSVKKMVADGMKGDRGYWGSIYVTLNHKYVLAKKIKGVVFGNSSSLGTHSNRHPKAQELIQEALRDAGAVMIPFVVFKEAGLNIENLKVIERGPEENVKRITGYNNVEKKNEKGKKYTDKEPVYGTVHFTGSSLIELAGRQFLFDIDRNEIKHFNFNAFMVELPKKVGTIKEAYESLKPPEVIKALKDGLDVKRQGEWFFIPAPKSLTKKISKMTEREQLILLASQTYSRIQSIIDKDVLAMVKKEAPKITARVPITRNLKAGDNRPNTVEFCVQFGKTNCCKGKVQHTGREHADLILKEWHTAVPNTAVKSFTITGDID
ncbi:MAG: hypothetical protein HQK96_01620 [Nitrospirae bacterium]|nr:hypothetical protein [Nitrospirota bacterium]